MLPYVQSLGHLGTSPGHAKLGADGGVGALAMGALEIATFRCHQRWNPNEKSPCKNEGYTQREIYIYIYMYVCNVVMYVCMYVCIE